MSVWLIITNPYSYDEAMEKAINLAKAKATKLKVVFFICDNSLGEMMHELGQMGWLGAGSFRNLQSSMFQGYRALAGDVLARVKRKAKDVELEIVGVVEQPSLQDYIEKILQTKPLRIIIAGSRLFNPKLRGLPDKVEYIEE
ncbi:MAG: hypothetical protein D6756_14355 [Cyanobacteria bacterium J083]|nr:MAG: hypothetical protein D6756_14355 [Cyanobacteria bacterium J083]